MTFDFFVTNPTLFFFLQNCVFHFFFANVDCFERCVLVNLLKAKPCGPTLPTRAKITFRSKCRVYSSQCTATKVNCTGGSNTSGYIINCALPSIRFAKLQTLPASRATAASEEQSHLRHCWLQIVVETVMCVLLIVVETVMCVLLIVVETVMCVLLTVVELVTFVLLTVVETVMCVVLIVVELVTFVVLIVGELVTFGALKVGE